MKLAVVGSRDFPYQWMVTEWLSGCNWLREIVSGGARGVDLWAEEWADCNGWPTMIFLPDWDALGKSAGFVRNQQIVEYADEVVAFQHNESKGTHHTIKLAREAGKLMEVIRVVSRNV